MCNEPRSNIHLKKPLGNIFSHMESAAFNFVSALVKKAKKSIYKAYYIKLEPVFVNNIYIPKYQYRIGITHFLPKKYWYRIGC